MLHRAYSGQQINLSNSAFCVGSKAAHMADEISSITWISQKQLPFTYFGVPAFNGKMKAVYFEYIVEKIRKRLAGWKAHNLSFGGWITLINSVLCSIPIYTLASSMVPKSVLRCIDKIIANFLLNSQGERCAHWISWESVCYPKEEGVSELI